MVPPHAAFINCESTECKIGFQDRRRGRKAQTFGYTLPGISARQVVLTLVNSADPQKQAFMFHGILTLTARQSFIKQLWLRHGSP